MRAGENVVILGNRGNASCSNHRRASSCAYQAPSGRRSPRWCCVVMAGVAASSDKAVAEAAGAVPAWGAAAGVGAGWLAPCVRHGDVKYGCAWKPSTSRARDRRRGSEKEYEGVASRRNCLVSIIANPAGLSLWLRCSVARRIKMRRRWWRLYWRMYACHRPYIGLRRPEITAPNRIITSCLGYCQLVVVVACFENANRAPVNMSASML